MTGELKQTKNLSLKLEQERGLKLFFKKIETNYDSSSSRIFCVAPLFLSPPIYASNDKKITQFS
jgi:hypothetical protein